jgi:hypothetical protein
MIGLIIPTTIQITATLGIRLQTTQAGIRQTLTSNDNTGVAFLFVSFLEQVLDL